MRWSLVAMGALALACGSEENNDNPFGIGTSASATASASGGGKEDDADASTGGDTDAGSSSGGGAGSSTSGGGESTSVDPTTATTAPGTTTDPGTTGGGEETGVGDPGVQPADGLYSPCMTGMECDPIPALCITINDMDGNPMDGFCSITPCNNAAVDCVPTPGATAVPACIPVTVDGSDTNACALDCSGGATCPTGMNCYSLAFGMICA